MFEDLTDTDACRVDAFLAAMTNNDRAMASAVRSVVFEDTTAVQAAREHGVVRTTLVHVVKRFRARFGVYLEQAGRCPTRLAS